MVKGSPPYEFVAAARRRAQRIAEEKMPTSADYTAAEPRIHTTLATHPPAPRPTATPLHKTSCTICSAHFTLGQCQGETPTRSRPQHQ